MKTKLGEMVIVLFDIQNASATEFLDSPTQALTQSETVPRSISRTFHLDRAETHRAEIRRIGREGEARGPRLQGHGATPFVLSRAGGKQVHAR